MSFLAQTAMEGQLSQIDLLKAMYPSPGELVLDHATQDLLLELRGWCDGERAMPSSIPGSISLALYTTIGENGSETRVISLTINVPLKPEELDNAATPSLKVRVRQPDWMNKSGLAELTANMPTDDPLAAVDYLHEQAIRYIKPASQSQHISNTIEGPINRVWFYFPSLSTRDKRDDLVNYAPGYGLTGFVLAGKPGVLCLEGLSNKIDAYMKFIKTESWGDIPAHQKKVSERYREDRGNITRVFGNMQEITDTLGEKRGERANRGDMKALEAWLKERGLQTAFEKVLM